MFAIAVENESLVWQETEAPHGIASDEVRIEVAWAGVNRADLMQRAGQYPPPEGASQILGLEVSGTIREVGRHVERFKVGDPVCALLSGGGYAEEVVVNALQVLPVPEGYSLRDAAALPEMFATAWLNLFIEGNLKHKERVLLHAGASGIGTTAIQLCGLFGHPCFVTVGSQEKLETCLRLGADAGWNRHDGSFVEAVNDWGGADMILDPVGGGYLADNQQVLKQDGRMVLIGLMGGRMDELDLGRMLMKRQRLIGSTLRSRSPDGKGMVLDALYVHVWPRLARGELRPHIDKSWPIQEADAAHAYVQDNASTGKVLLAVTGA
ncbi:MULTISPECIES: NAD(P)H-quinone oxidoreductase [Cobetia]|jgi:putative PIG3 family NAD(P)H quinone oxidoreductase|uniref:NAD(P)H-quinone oxidoreductase n=2 Tax=Cobetia TaxID=204286 RepID=A0AAP4U2W8_9GAMM|nr:MULTISPECIES: NAD(P)H-quinone oxidoreductase [Cobetia]AVV34349.1 NAD(P)H-quinone oxidoreductase [Halomonas sp. SF2003]MBR9756363.1 NAD(P)H-quinone oxidoreductase [Gammaproteobacteria bacterium]NVN57313.1 NAD(P)H-quinone oxidoreductase [bacterium Scap17]TCJ27339.1 NAD(P)H-quinone oxidoreductase [Halomonas sp. GDM18]UTV85799.1 NAD(P)H-quinone oxidoreductase [Cobetia litoralis]|tara:strand:+ start:3693 stop:4661 length:969 start_codon:yes stop_codon:yes gene_type:complete